MAAALVLALVPVAARAGAPSGDEELPPLPDAEQPPPPDTQPIPPDGIFAPIDIPAPPPKPKPPPEPVVVPEPEFAPVEPPVEGPQVARANHEQLEQIRAQRTTGIAVMAVGGGFTAVGFGMTLAFTLLGDQAQNADEPVLEDVEKHDSMARAGGILLASGVALVAVGGIVFANANKKARAHEAEAMARVRVVPAVGGLVLSGRF